MMRSLLSLVLAAIVSLAHLAYAANEANESTPEQVLAALKDGNARFVEVRAKAPHRDAERRTETAKNGQRPNATVIACSDSREPVEILFDQGIGDLFVIRVAGNVANTDEIGSAEYGCEHLGTPLLLVLGHTECGAVTAVVTHADVHGSIPALIAPIKPAVDKAQKEHPELKGKELVPAAIDANVFQSIQDLLKCSAMLRQLVKDGKLRMEGAVYDIATGQIKWLGAHPQQKALLEMNASAVREHEPEPVLQGK
jgi:carbonic anhydrase